MDVLTYIELYELAKKNGYDITDSSTSFPYEKGTTLVNMTPEMAEKLVKHDSRLFQIDASAQRIKNNSKSIENNSWCATDTGNVHLLTNYKVWKGMCILEAIKETKQATDVYVTVTDKLIYGPNLELIIDTIVSGVKSVLENHGLELPELESQTWYDELPGYIDLLDIMIRDRDFEPAIEDVQQPTLVGVLNSDRTEEYPDLLYIVRGETANAFECNLAPLCNCGACLCLKPGRYEDYLCLNKERDTVSKTKKVIGLFQGMPQPFYEIHTNEENKLSGKTSGFMDQFMVVRDENTDGHPGFRFKDVDTKQAFFDALNEKTVFENITYIVIGDIEETIQAKE